MGAAPPRGDGPALVLDGRSLTPATLTAAVRHQWRIAAAAGARAAVAAGAALAAEVADRRPIYGRSTGVGANRGELVDEAHAGDHGMRLLRAHAGGAGPLRPAEEARAAMVVRANQLAHGSSGLGLEVFDGLLAAIDAGFVPPLRQHGSLGTGDLDAFAELGLALAGELPWADPPERRRFCAFTTGDALPFTASNGAMLAMAALAATDLRVLVDAATALTALVFVATAGNAEAWSEVVAEARPHASLRNAATVLRALVGTTASPARIQDPFALRCAPQVLGPSVDALDHLDAVLTVDLNAAATNPLFAGGDAWHNGNFHHAGAALAMDHARLAIHQLAQMSSARLALLMDERLTGQPRFLADGVAGSSGVLILEYTAHAALAELRQAADPTTRGAATISLGLEEHASFAWQGAIALRRVADAYQTVLACELVAAVRAVRMTGRRPAVEPLAGALAAAETVLPVDPVDRALVDDVELAASLLNRFAAAFTQASASLR